MPPSGEGKSRGPGQDRAEGSPSSGEAPAQDEAPPALVCRACGTAISREDAVFSAAQGGAVGVYANPGGWLRRVVTVRWAENLRLVGEPTEEFTWFPGFAWRVAECGGCGQHLGWRYDDPAGFHGLVLDRLREGDAEDDDPS